MKSKIFYELKSYIIITIGLVIFVFGWTTFIIPCEIAGGGISGLASVIYYATGFPVSYSYFLVNLVLLAIGFSVLGKGFGVKTLYGIAMSSLLFQFLPEIVNWTTDIHSDLMNTVIGSTLSGFGIGFVIQQGGSAGGTDIVALVISKFRNISLGKVFLYCDLAIISSVYFLPGKTLENVMYGFVEIAVFAYVIDMVMSGEKRSVQVMIFSQHYHKIADRINTELERGVTALNATGWYSKEENKVLMIIIRKSEINQVYRIVKETDPRAFMSVSNVSGVYGEGFETIKTNKPLWNRKKDKSNDNHSM